MDKKLYFISLVIILLSYFLGFFALCVIILVLFTTVHLVKNLGETLGILELMAFIASIQWILGPYFAYHLPETFVKYSMGVFEDTYFEYSVLPTTALVYGLLYKSKSTLSSLKDRLLPYKKQLAFRLIFLGMASYLISPFLPRSLSFFLYLLSGLIYVGILIYYRNKNNPYRNISLVLGLLWLLFQATDSGIFHTLILWGAIFFCFYQGYFQKTVRHRMLAFIGAFSILFLIQLVKSDYRLEIAKGKGQISVLSDLITEKIMGQEQLLNPEVLAELNVRLNQGWIISKIYDHVPENEPFAEGSSVKEAITNSIVPRVLDANKKRAGGKENFEKFTGEFLNTSTSMGVSVLGEGFANFGKRGNILFMLLYALLIRKVYYWLQNKGDDMAFIIYLIPLVFLQVIKAETELYVVLNHLFKSLFLLLVSLPLIRKLHVKHLYAES